MVVAVVVVCGGGGGLGGVDGIGSILVVSGVGCSIGGVGGGVDGDCIDDDDGVNDDGCGNIMSTINA